MTRIYLLKGPWLSALAVAALAMTLAGCFGASTAMRGSGDTGSGDTFEVAMGDMLTPGPDNCTKCHFAWALKFDYYRGWDRYGYIFDDRSWPGYYEPSAYPELNDLHTKYYQTEWWKDGTVDLNPWPDGILHSAEGLSVISRGMPIIPKTLADISGPVIIVAKSGGDVKTIKKAVRKAKAGTTIFVKEGVYNECVELKDGVSLIGEDPYATIINPKNAGHAIVAANNSVIAGFTLTGTGIVYATREFNCAIYVSGCDESCVIANNIFRENGLFGVWIDGAPDKKADKTMLASLGGRAIEMEDRPYTDYPNPIICGNTFYRIGQRGVFCVHGKGEIFNNIFLGNVKAVGLERGSQPFFHHNVCYFNNIPMAVNRSQPLVANNIMLGNQWGQRMLRGANPVMFGNVTWESPHYRDFDEDGIPEPYLPHPGAGELEIDPKFTDPLAGDFTFTDDSPLKNKTLGWNAVGIMRDESLPQPNPVKCRNSWGREVLSMNDEIVDLIGKIVRENDKIKSLSSAYDISYKSWLKIEADELGDPEKYSITRENAPVVAIEYTVPEWSMKGDKREKRYTEKRSANGASTTTSSKVVYNGRNLFFDEASGAVPTQPAPDAQFVGERPYRERPGGFYRDYDQFVKAAAGPTGTFIHGYLRIMGGVILEDSVVIDGHSCIVVRYPHIGKDQYFNYYLDPAIGYRPRKIEQFLNMELCRVMDGYVYKEFPGSIHLPLKVNVTDFAVLPPCTGQKIGAWSLTVDEKKLKVNAL